MMNRLRVITEEELNTTSDELLDGYMGSLAVHWGSLLSHERSPFLPMIENIKKIQARRLWLKARDAFIAHLRSPETDDEALLALLSEKLLYLDNVVAITFEHLGQLNQVALRVDASNVEEQRDLIEAEIERRNQSKQ
jgi:hypothetical protein